MRYRICTRWCWKNGVHLKKHGKHFIQSVQYSSVSAACNTPSQDEDCLADIVSGWPFCVGNKVLLHLDQSDLTTVTLHEEDFYFFISNPVPCAQQLGQGDLLSCHGLLVGCYWNHSGSIHTRALTTEQFVNILSGMDSHSSHPIVEDDLRSQLKKCLVSVERKVERLTQQQVSESSHETKNYDTSETSEPLPLKEEYVSFSVGSDQVHFSCREEAKIQHNVGNDRSSTMIPQPSGVMSVNFGLLQSGVAILTGARDSRGGSVVIIFTKLLIWSSTSVSSKDLAKLLMYFYGIPRDEVQQKGLSIIVDAQEATADAIDILLEAMFLLQSNIPCAIFVVHIVADRAVQSVFLKALKPHHSFKLDLLSSSTLLYKFVGQDKLPVEFDGQFGYDHEEWISFRMQLEPFMDNCKKVGAMLISAMRCLGQEYTTPSSVNEANKLIDKQHEMMRKIFDEPALVSLQTEGEAIIKILNKDRSDLGATEDYKDAMSSLHKLYAEVHVTLGKLMEVCKKRKEKLEEFIKLQRHKEVTLELIEWLVKDGEDLLNKHSHIATNLKAVKVQQRDFEKTYFSATTQVAKVNDLLEESKHLTSIQSFELSDIKAKLEKLAILMKNFKGRLEDTRDRIEATAKSYSLLDKSYEWALEAMKYVAGMKMDNCSSTEGLDKLSVNLDIYLKDHPPIPAETFDLMHQLATKLGNERLQEQCKVARSRCSETEQLIRVRQLTLCKAKEQLDADEIQSSKSDLNTVLEHSPDRALINSHGVRLRARKTNDGGVWVPRSNSTPALSDYSTRRKSYGGSPSTPILQRCPSAPVPSEYEEQLFNDGMISEDISSVLSANVSQKQTALEGDSKKTVTIAGLSRTNDCSLVSPAQTCVQTVASANSVIVKNPRRPHRKQMRRANTLLALSSMPVLETDLQDVERCVRTVSMITGSSDSLPSLPEEDETRVPWSPVPVNTHLLSQKLSGAHYGSMADLRLTETQVKSRRTLCLVMQEMIQTERDYVRSLQYVIENFMPELNREDVPQSLRGKRNIIFGNIQKIYQFHSQYFLQELETCSNYPFNVSNCFLNHEQEFYLYALYNKNKPKSDNLMQEFGTAFFRQKQNELGDKMDLGSYLLKPVQRMGKYALMLKQIIRECPETDQLYNHLKAAEEMARFQLRHGNDLLAMDSIRDCDVNLNEQGRLLRQDEFLVWRGRKKTLRHVFLFEECLILSKTKRHSGHHDTYIYKNSFKTTDLGFTETLTDSSPHKFEIWFRKQKHGESYVLQAASVDIKGHWTCEISRLLWKQAIKNRESRLTEMASMGIGNKPCLDLKQSTDNIKDRFINASLHSRARTRNSIAVSSFDHFKNGSKRPHSIISISSSSSSSSSNQSGAGLFGPLGLAFDPQDNMWTSRRKSSAATAESSIIPDLPEESPEQASEDTRTVVRSDSGASIFSSSSSGGGFVATTKCVPGEPLVTDV